MSDYSIINADILLSSDNNTEVIDIRQNIMELAFYESLHRPYIDAHIVMVDDFGFRDQLSIQGTERINLVIATGEDINEGVINKTFFFSRITDALKNNERSEILAIDLVEEHVYVNAMKSISRSYTKRMEDMIVDIMDRELGREVIKSEGLEPSAQGERKVIIPYLSPLEAVNWIRDRITTKTGSPVYLHSDLYSRNIYMSSLEQLMAEDLRNEKLPLRFNDASASADPSQEKLTSYYQIKSFQQVDAEDSLALYEEGAIGSFYSNLDAGTGQTYGTHISVRNIIDDFYTYGMISKETSQSIFDPTLNIAGRPSDEYDALFIHQVTSSKTYNQFKSYHDEAIRLDENNAVFESRLKIKNKIIRQILKKNVIDIQMDGALYIEKKVSPGDRLRIVFLSPNTKADPDKRDGSLDTRRSGDYLLTDISHKMSLESHDISARLIKLGDLPSDFSL